MATIDLGKVKGEDGKDGVGGGSASIELLEKPMLESEVYQAKAGSSSDFVTYPKWNIPIQIDKIKSPPKVGDIISIELESPFGGSGGRITKFKLDFKCRNADTVMAADNIPLPITVCSFRICAITEPNVITANKWNGGLHSGVVFQQYNFDDIVLLGGADDFEYIHGLAEVLDYADEHCGGIIEGAGSTADFRKEYGNGNILELIAFYSGDNVAPWWKYSTSASTDTSGNISCLWFLYPSDNSTPIGSLPTSFEACNIKQASSSRSRGWYTGQYLIKSVRYKEMS